MIIILTVVYVNILKDVITSILRGSNGSYKHNREEGGKAMIRTYSLKTDGEKKLSPHFKVKEFACNDRSEKILISDELVALLEKIREHFGKPINIASGYRTTAYNRACGGADKSQHLYGTAADIRIAGIDPLRICQYAEMQLLKGGIGHYIGSKFSHVDVRSKRARWKQIRSDQPNISISGFGLPTLRKDSKDRDSVIELQKALNKFGYALKVDGDFGTNTLKALVDFQGDKGLTVDGVCGANTWKALGV